MPFDFNSSFNLAGSLIRCKIGDLHVAQNGNIDFAGLAYPRCAGKLRSIEDFDIYLVTRTDSDGWWTAGLLIGEAA